MDCYGCEYVCSGDHIVLGLAEARPTLIIPTNHMCACGNTSFMIVCACVRIMQVGKDHERIDHMLTLV